MTLKPSELPERFEVRTRGALDAAVRPPGSKSITNRALLIAALASGESVLRGALSSDDTEAMLECLRALGGGVDAAGDAWRVPGRAGHLRAPARRREVAHFFREHPVPSAKRVLRQTLERFDWYRGFRQQAVRELRKALG